LQYAGLSNCIFSVATSKKTRQGLKQISGRFRPLRIFGCNEQENPTGIETARQKGQNSWQQCCNEQENPTGIETMAEAQWIVGRGRVATSKKTRQGLKHRILRIQRQGIF